MENKSNRNERKKIKKNKRMGKKKFSGKGKRVFWISMIDPIKETEKKKEMVRK